MGEVPLEVEQTPAEKARGGAQTGAEGGRSSGLSLPCSAGVPRSKEAAPPSGPYSRSMTRALRWSWGGGAVSYERGTPVARASSPQSGLKRVDLVDQRARTSSCASKVLLFC